MHRGAASEVEAGEVVGDDVTEMTPADLTTAVHVTEGMFVCDAATEPRATSDRRKLSERVFCVSPSRRDKSAFSSCAARNSALRTVSAGFYKLRMIIQAIPYVKP